MGNRFVIILVAGALLFFGLLFFNKKDAGAPSTAVSASNHLKGSGSVVLVEYGDFECPGCARFEPIIRQVIEKYGDKITFQFRNFPLTQIHQNAMAAHRASEAADKQGKYWEMHDVLFDNRTSWIAEAGVSTSQAVSIFEGYAQQLGLDVEKFKQDVSSSAVNDVIQADIKAGQDLRVTSTPTFFLDGTKLEDARDTLEYFS
jgi:protein-disulfide isomerase